MVGITERGAWRVAFLRALGAGGSVAGAARVAGVDKGIAYDHRKRDPAFAAEWARIKTAAQARLQRGEAPPSIADDEVVRGSRVGRPCVARAGSGRWSAAIERRFLEELASTANVLGSATAVGLSTTALYKRRGNWPCFAARWDVALAQGYARLEAALVREATATAEREPVAGEDREGPSFAERLQLLKFHRHGVTGEGRAPRHGWRHAEPPIEQVHAELLRRIKAVGG